MRSSPLLGKACQDMVDRPLTEGVWEALPWRVYLAQQRASRPPEMWTACRSEVDRALTEGAWEALLRHACSGTDFVPYAVPYAVPDTGLCLPFLSLNSFRRPH